MTNRHSLITTASVLMLAFIGTGLMLTNAEVAGSPANEGFHVQGGLGVDEDLQVNGNANVQQDLDVQGGLGVNEDLQVSGGANVQGDLNVAGNIVGNVIMSRDENLRVKTTGRYSLAITADYITLYNSLGQGVVKTIPNAITANITGTSLDTGYRALYNWYYVYVIWNPTNNRLDVRLSLSETAPTLPAGYTFARRVSAVYYGRNYGDSYTTGNFRQFSQVDDLISFGYNKDIGLTTRDLFGNRYFCGSSYDNSANLNKYIPKTAKSLIFINGEKFESSDYYYNSYKSSFTFPLGLDYTFISPLNDSLSRYLTSGCLFLNQYKIRL